MPEIEVAGFHPLVVPVYRDDGLYESPAPSLLDNQGFHPLVVPARRDGG